jgi:DNA invertase Pin-like site-specific DNA recombinase
VPELESDDRTRSSGVITLEHRQRCAAVYVRQSTPDQVKENTGSTAAQRDLWNVAVRLGWPESRIIRLEDLGVSGTSNAGRGDYLRLLTMMDQDEIGIVLVADLSRLSRKRSDIASFLELAEEKNVLIYTNGAVHDPASGDVASTLGLDIAGTFGSWDNRIRARRMRDAKLAKAKRGLAVSPPPIGYVRTPAGGWIKDPDKAVQDAILRTFNLYQELSSLGKVIAYFREHGLEFPRRSRGQIRWGPMDAALVHSVLHNPAYMGDYVFQRRKTKKRSDTTGMIVKFRPPEEWIVTPDHHEVYVSREQWRRIQQMLASHRPKLRPLIGKGHALLQGLLRCAACNRWMNAQYWGREGIARTATYTCIRQNGWGKTTHKMTIPARYIDHAVVEHVLSALTAIDEETALTVIERHQAECTALERAHRRHLLDADQEVDDLYTLLKNLPPHLHAAHIGLMTKYDAAVQRQLELKSQLSKQSMLAPLTSADVDDLTRLTGNVRQLWGAPERTYEQKKQLLRAVIAEINVHRADREGADVEIVWIGGHRERLTVLRPRGVEAVVAKRTRDGETSVTIADELNRTGIVTASGNPVSPQLVARKQGPQGLRLKDERRVARHIIREGLLARRPRPEILRELQTQAPRLGPWEPQRLSDFIRQLRRGVAGIDPLLPVLPVEQDKQRVLDLIDAALAAGGTWTSIAIALNDAGLKPPRGAMFTPVQVRLLYMRAHGLRSFKLPSAQSDNQASNA